MKSTTNASESQFHRFTYLMSFVVFVEAEISWPDLANLLVAATAFPLRWGNGLVDKMKGLGTLEPLTSPDVYKFLDPVKSSLVEQASEKTEKDVESF